MDLTSFRRCSNGTPPLSVNTLRLTLYIVRKDTIPLESIINDNIALGRKEPVKGHLIEFGTIMTTVRRIMPITGKEAGLINIEHWDIQLIHHNFLL